MLEYSTTVQLLTEHDLEFLSLKGDCTGSSESTLVKMSHCWKSRVTAQILFMHVARSIVAQLEGHVMISSREGLDESALTRNLEKYSFFCSEGGHSFFLSF